MSQKYSQTHNPRYVHAKHSAEPLPAIRAGKLGDPEIHTEPGGATASAGKIVFTGNFVAGDTVTIDTTSFVAVVSGAAGNQFNIGGTLATSLSNLASVLNASANATVALFTWTVTDTNTSITGTPDAAGANCNIKLASTHSTSVVTQPAGGKDVPAVSLETAVTVFNVATGFNANLGAGDEGQQITVSNIGAGTIVLKAGTNGIVGSKSQVSMPQNSVVQLLYINSLWHATFNEGATIS